LKIGVITIRKVLGGVGSIIKSSYDLELILVKKKGFTEFRKFRMKIF
jgi:hypothetical protein